MFWQQYRRTALFIQLTILFVAGTAYLAGHFYAVQIAMIVLVMEIAALLGAAWAVRLKRKVMAVPPLKLKRSQF